jgi:hypothetical protein
VYARQLRETCSSSSHHSFTHASPQNLQSGNGLHTKLPLYFGKPPNSKIEVFDGMCGEGSASKSLPCLQGPQDIKAGTIVESTKKEADRVMLEKVSG